MTMTSSTCCGCHLVDDYGTSIVEGDGSLESPYSVSQVDPLFNRPVVRTHQEYEFVVPNNSPTAVEYTGVIFDSHNMFTLDQPTRLTIPVDGVYLIGYNFAWEIAAVFYRAIDIRLNGLTVLDTHTQIANMDETAFSGNYVYFFNVGDYIEIVARQTSGGNRSLVGSFQFGGEDSVQRYGLWMIHLGQKV